MLCAAAQQCLTLWDPRPDSTGVQTPCLSSLRTWIVRLGPRAAVSHRGCYSHSWRQALPPVQQWLRLEGARKAEPQVCPAGSAQGRGRSQRARPVGPAGVSPGQGAATVGPSRLHPRWSVQGRGQSQRALPVCTPDGQSRAGGGHGGPFPSAPDGLPPPRPPPATSSTELFSRKTQVRMRLRPGPFVRTGMPRP